MRRLLGSLLILHAAAHAAAGVLATGVRPSWIVTPLWFIATAGFLIAGIGLLGIERVDRQWRPIANVAAMASLGLLALYSHPVFMVGAAIDGALLITSIPFVWETVVRQIGVPAHPAHRRLSRVATAVAVACAAYLSGMILLRPWHTSSGVSADEATTLLHGEESIAGARYRGEGTPTFLSVTLSPLNLLVFEPAHFVMETRMLKGIKERAERRRS